jgi:type III secretion system YscI/HrpB-like protein
MTELSGIQQAMQKLADKAAHDHGLPAGQVTADAGDVERLKAALQAPAMHPQAAQAADKVPGVTAAEESTPGTKILDGLNNVRTGFNEALHDLEKTLSVSPDSPSELIKVQLRLQRVTLQQDLLGKVTSKAEQNVDTLLKGQ